MRLFSLFYGQRTKQEVNRHRKVKTGSPRTCIWSFAKAHSNKGNKASCNDLTEETINKNSNNDAFS